MIEHIPHSRPFLGNSETSINHTALHIKSTWWPLTRITGNTGKDRDLNSHKDITTKEDTESIDIGHNKNSESINSLDTMLAFGGSEVDGHLGDLLPNIQANLTVFTKEINSLQLWVEAREGQPVEGLGCIEWELQNLSFMLRAQLTATLAPSEPFGEVIHQYTDTLCTSQKQTNLTNALLQEIAIFNEHDSTKLEEWLTDLETAGDLTYESWTKLAKEKSRGLTHTLVMEAINSETAWDEIKDLLRLKLCNANIYTYTSCFMDIQQWEKESLAACVHQFKS